MSSTSDKLSILDSFIEEVNSYLPEIESNLQRLAESPTDMDALEETYRRTHTIGGSASMMSFPGLAHVAHGMEDILCDVLDGLTALEEPTLSLLVRSFGRIRVLVNGIRSGVDEAAIIAEDDADYSRYRTAMNAAESQVIGQQVPIAQPTQENTLSQAHVTPSPTLQTFDMSEMAVPLSQSMPSFDEVLASFRTPSIEQAESVDWPEEIAQPVPEPKKSAPPERTKQEDTAKGNVSIASTAQTPMSSIPATPSALDTLIASTKQSIPAVTPSLVSSTKHEQEPHITLTPLAAASGSSLLSTPPTTPAAHTTVTQLEEYSDLQHDAQALEQQVTSLKNIVAQLRSAMIVVEEQRSEFKGFLDGSKDALERMEDWAGKAMGLNLRNSPEQVRRYLPLSVMWVSNTRLKKVLDLLLQVTSNTELTDEQLHVALRQLHTSIASCGIAFEQMQAAQGLAFTHDQGWTPWSMQVARGSTGNDVQERVTFERRGDVESLRAELETQLRQKLQHEYEERSLAEQVEAEQRIRDEVRREYELRLHTQQREQTSNVGRQETPQEVEARLRSSIEIQVRQEVLESLSGGNGDLASLIRSAQPATPATPPSPTTSNFADRARQATGQAPAASSATPLAQQKPVAAPTPPVQSAKPVPPLAQSASPVGPQPDSVRTAPTSFGGDFGEEAIEIFRLEAEEHLQTISFHVAALEKDPTNKELIQGVRRATHTLKGAAGMMGFRAIADLCHVSEDLLDSIMEGNTEITSVVLSIILDTAETLDSLITGKGAGETSDEARVNALRTRYAALLGEQSTPYNAAEIDLDDTDDPITDTKLVAGIVSEQFVDLNSHRSGGGELSVRVRLQKLDELVNLFGELLVNRSVLEERVQRLIRLVADVGISSNRLRDVGQKLESNFEAATLPSGHSVQVMPGEGMGRNGFGTNGKSGRSGTEPAHLADFDELELDRYTEFHRLARGLSEGISDMTTLSAEMDAVIRECEGVFARENRLSTTFQDRLMKVRLMPLSSMTPRLYRAARVVALKQGKDFEFLLEGEETEVERTVFEEISGPLLHLMRNAVNHAIETPEVRIKRGKSPVGQITLSAMYEGNQVVITVRDDGNGIDAEHVRATAIARGLIRPEHELSEGEVIDLIFRPGFSTADVLSEESGRGVGLDVVHDSVSRLRGTIEVESMPGQGTAFTMKFPTSLAIQSAMMVMVAGQQYAIPTTMIESIGRLDNFERRTISGQPAIMVRNTLYPLTMLAQYLSLPVSPLDDKSPILLVNNGGQRVALVVDDIKTKQDIVMKSLGPHLRQINGIAGATVLGNGRVVLILELIELLSTRPKIASTLPRRESATAQAPQIPYTPQVPQIPQTPQVNQPAVQMPQTPFRQTVRAERQPMSPVKAPIPSTADRGKYVLVVDDSPSVRRVVGNMLKQNNWEVQMARDGVEALDMIAREIPAAVLLDIEMPRMDGYELTATIRSQEQYRTLPLIVLTSRAAAKHQQRALQLGANAYLIKPYQDEELLNMLNSLVYGAVVR